MVFKINKVYRTEDYYLQILFTRVRHERCQGDPDNYIKDKLPLIMFIEKRE